jgi:microcompartment protein CcmL/EutN
MGIGDLMQNPMVKRALAAGEERMGRLVTQLLSSEKVMHRVQTVVSSALTAKTTFDRGVKTAMQAVNLPTTEDVEELRTRLAELETLLDGLAARVPSGDRAGKGQGTAP